MECVLGIGGVFFKARDPKALAAWYRHHLGVPVEPGQTHGSFTAVAAGERAFRMSGVRHAEIDVAQFYDAFTIVPILALEALAFCGPGEGGPFVSGQRTAPGGDFPMNTNGGGLSYTHPGMYGMFILIEAVRQLRGEAGDRQVKDARLACVNGTGGTLSSTGTLILGVD